MHKHAKVLRFMAGTGVEIHYLGREKGPVQGRKGERKQCDEENTKGRSKERLRPDTPGPSTGPEITDVRLAWPTGT